MTPTKPLLRRVALAITLNLACLHRRFADRDIHKLTRDIVCCIALDLAVLVVVSCATNPGLISEEQARNIALRAANSGDLRALAPPSGIQSELLDLETARSRLGQGNSYEHGPSLQTKVWLVIIQGVWTMAGGPPTPVGAAPAPGALFHRYAVIIDASTGAVISESSDS